MSDPWTPVAIVTGAASGIGLATVRALLKRGASVVTAVCPGPTLTGMTDRLSETPRSL